MSGCVLRVSGDRFEPESFLANASLVPYLRFQKGGPPMSGDRIVGGPSRTSGFCCEVSPDGSSFEQQTRDAISFLTRYRTEIEQLRRLDTVKSLVLDFGYECRLNNESVCVQSDLLPNELLHLAGSLGLNISLSLYPLLDRSNLGGREKVPATEFDKAG